MFLIHLCIFLVLLYIFSLCKFLLKLVWCNCWLLLGFVSDQTNAAKDNFVLEFYLSLDDVLDETEDTAVSKTGNDAQGEAISVQTEKTITDQVTFTGSIVGQYCRPTSVYLFVKVSLSCLMKLKCNSYLEFKKIKNLIILWMYDMCLVISPESVLYLSPFPQS